MSWYAIFFTIGIALIVYAIVAANYIFAVLLVLFGTFMVMQHFRDPVDVPIVILSTGLAIGNHYHKWDELRTFSIVYEPPDVQKLYLNFISNKHPLVGIDMPEGLDPSELRDIFLDYVDEDFDLREETLTDYARRLYKL